MAKNPDFEAVVKGTLNRLMEKNILSADKFTVAFNTIFSGMTPKYFSQDDFTVAVLQNVNTGMVMAVGVSKRNPTDQRLPLRGRSLALSRAVKEFTVKSVMRAASASVSDLPADPTSSPTHIDRRFQYGTTV